jgi:anti-sigma B factor antagonist
MQRTRTTANIGVMVTGPRQPDTDGLEVALVPRVDGALVRVSGELTLATATQLASELAEAELSRPALLVLDLRGVRFIDSTGLAELVAAHKRSRRHRRRLIIVIAPGTVQRLLEVTGLARELETATEPPVSV